MTTPRFNGFQLIHKALRLMLFETGTSLQRNDFLNSEQTVPLMDRLKTILGYYEDHARHENTFILPQVAKQNPDFIKDFESDHEADHRLVQQLLSNISKWEQAGSDEEKIEAGKQIFYGFNEFTAFNLYHMNKEEKVLNTEIWKHFSDEEIMGWSQKIIQSIPVEKLMAQNHWMFRAISAGEALLMLQGVAKMAPPEVAHEYQKIAEQELLPEQWELVKRNLGMTA